MRIPWIDEQNLLPPASSAQKAGSELAGLVAAGADLSVSRLYEAYSKGIFPWFNKDQPVLWWSPDPRMVLQVDHFKLHRSLRKTLQNFQNQADCELRMDTAFEQVIRHCAHSPRKGASGTWILPSMVDAYVSLHHAGFAHSVETWCQGKLVGGLYCVSIGDTLFGESMFANRTDASKIALAGLVAFARSQGLTWIDCQQNTKHLASLGAKEIPRSTFIQWVEQTPKDTNRDWTFKRNDWDYLFI